MDETVSPPLLVAEMLSAAGIEFAVHRHPSIRTADDIRARTDFAIDQSVKVMVFTADEQHVVLAAFPGPARLQYGRLAAAVGVARKSLRPAGEALLTQLGMEPGGAGPFCTDPGVMIVVDAAVPNMGRVYCGSGRADHTLEVDAAEIVRLAENPVIGEISTSRVE